MPSVLSCWIRFYLVLAALLAAGQGMRATTITAIGDSFTIGDHGFDDADLTRPMRSYPGQLAGILGVEVINWGRGGRTSAQVREHWLENATAEQRAGIVIMAVGTNNIRDPGGLDIVDDVRRVIASLTGGRKRFILLLHPHAGTSFDAAKRQYIVRAYRDLKAAFPEYGVDLWDFHVDAEGVVATEFRRFNPNGQRDGLHPNSLWYGEVAKRVAARIRERGWLDVAPRTETVAPAEKR